MEFKNLGNTLLVVSSLFTDEDYIFCGRPEIRLYARKEQDGEWWHAYSIAIKVGDEDDYDMGLIYQTTEETFFEVLHELINWMRDHEQGITIYENIRDLKNFFPDLNCPREYW